MVDNETVRIGITPYGIKDLLEIVYFELPNVHDKLVRSKQFGTIEGVAGILELVAPLSGTVMKINEELISYPELVNVDPYINWILLMKPSNFNKELKFLQDHTN